MPQKNLFSKVSVLINAWVVIDPKRCQEPQVAPRCLMRYSWQLDYVISDI